MFRADEDLYEDDDLESASADTPPAEVKASKDQSARACYNCKKPLRDLTVVDADIAGLRHPFCDPECLSKYKKKNP